MRVDDDGDFVLEEGAMKWEQSGKSITVTFREGKVVGKSQSGLK
jgi:hypothetical protein